LITSNTYLDTGLQNGETKYYVITAVDIYDSESARSLEVGIAPVAPDTTPPGQVTGLSATTASGQVSLIWNHRTESDTFGYNVYRSLSPNGTYIKINSSLIIQNSWNLLLLSCELS